MTQVGDRLNEFLIVPAGARSGTLPILVRSKQKRVAKSGKKLSRKPRGESLPDKEVVRRVLAGEAALFELLFRRHSQRVYRVARAILRDDGEAQDLVQEAYLRAYKHLDQFAGRAKFSTWLTRIAIHEARARLRGGSVRREKEATAAHEGSAIERDVTPTADPERRAFENEVKTILEAAVDALPTRYRTVFMMREIEAMSTAETADSLNLSRDTVKTRLHRARALLRKQLDASVGAIGARAFRFGGSRCDRMTSVLSERLKAETPGL